MINFAEGLEVFADCLEARKDAANPNAHRNFFGQLSPDIHIDYQGQPWAKGVPYVEMVSSTRCRVIGYTKVDRCDLAD